jgi:hypothetical protein
MIMKYDGARLVATHAAVSQDTMPKLGVAGATCATDVESFVE